MATNMARAVRDFSPPESSVSRLTFLPGGRASTSIPVVSMSSGSVSTNRPAPPGNRVLKTLGNSASTSFHASVNRVRMV